MSSTTITIDDLMLSLREPLPEISGYLEIIWDLDEPSMFDLDKILGADVEFIEEKKQLSSEITTVILSSVRKRSVESSHSLDNVTVEEILARLRCKCKDFKCKFAKKALKMDHGASSFTFSSSSEHSDESNKRPEVKSPVVISPKIGTICKEFMNVKDYAVSFIDDILQEAEEKVNFALETVYYGEDAENVQAPSEVHPTQVPVWFACLLIEDFTPLTGKKLILEAITNTWHLKKTWSFCIDLKAEHSDSCADFYIYEVRWSLPSMSYPIPQVTASVYFTIEVSRVKPKDCPVSVSYHFETERYKFNLEDDIQQEIFIKNIMRSKLDFYKSLRI